jgi:hypothetical protein
VELGHCLVDQARMLYDYGDQDDATVDKDDLAPWIRDTDWSEMDIDGGTYHLVLEPVNYLVGAREGRLAQVAELGKNGLIPDPAMQADLFDEPDIQRANRTILGPKHRLDRVMQGLADPKVPMLDLQPDQYMNLPLALLMANGELNEAMSHYKPGQPDDKLDQVCDRYRQFIELVKQEQARGQGMGVSPAGAQMNNIVAAQSAASLLPGMGGAPQPPMAPGGAAGPVVPPGTTIQ